MKRLHATHFRIFRVNKTQNIKLRRTQHREQADSCIFFLHNLPHFNNLGTKQHPKTMKLFGAVIVSSCLAAQAFGVTPVVSQTKGLGKPALVTNKSPLRQKNASELSPLFRDPTVTRGGAIPGLQAYSDALDKKPITMKALTSLVGWLLGDLLAQVSLNHTNVIQEQIIIMMPVRYHCF